MTEIFRGTGVGKVLTFSIDERVFGKSEYRFGTISGRNIQGMIFRSWKAHAPFVSFLSIFGNRVVDLWNRLPREVAGCNTVNTFKRKLDEYMGNSGWL